jgi:hypothetical protein
VPIPSAPDGYGAASEPIDGAKDEKHPTGGRSAVPGEKAGQAIQPRPRPGDTPPGAIERGKADGTLVPAAVARTRGRNRDHGGIGPRARKMDPIDLYTFILDSRYRTVNAVMILLASAVLAVVIAAAVLVMGARMNPVSTVGFTGAGTVIVSVLTVGRSVRKRRQEDQAQQADDDAGSPNGKRHPRDLGRPKGTTGRSGQIARRQRSRHAGKRHRP